MRAFILALALLAALKVWAQDTAYRSAAEEALISAYRARAAAACKKIAPKGKLASIQDAMADRWTDAEPHVLLGNPAIRVHVWEVDHELWNARFKQLYLVLSAGGSTRSCTYDITADTAEMTSS